MNWYVVQNGCMICDQNTYILVPLWCVLLNNKDSQDQTHSSKNIPAKYTINWGGPWPPFFFIGTVKFIEQSLMFIGNAGTKFGGEWSRGCRENLLYRNMFCFRYICYGKSHACCLGLVGCVPTVNPQQNE